MYLYLWGEREGERERERVGQNSVKSESLDYVDGEGGDPLAPVVHHLALCGRGVGGGEGWGAE